jgi:hypothetical protein
MKKLILFTLLACCVAFAGCSKDAEVEAFITEFDATTNEMVEKINANPSSEGIDAAQKVFEDKKPSLKAKFDSFKNARQAQVSEEVQKKLTESAMNNGKALGDAVMKNSAKFAGDAEAMEKFQKLMKDYAETFKM